MIQDNPESKFIFIFHPKILIGKKYTVRSGLEMTNGEVLQYWGKWIVLGEKSWLDELAIKLDFFVEDEKIPVIKYDREPSVNLGIEECVMMVYCDWRDRNQIWQILSRFGVKLKAWVTEKETMEMWLPGGLLLERWIESKKFNEVTQNKVREDAQARLGYIFEYPDEIFVPWEQ
ncbi:MAG: hypothetical protein HY881_14135 [Deltaproteobacteria bacterium]|nr:hypothetical protein [Deltaproteobacteria bacterium]